jgi:hypothetical protein
MKPPRHTRDLRRGSERATVSCTSRATQDSRPYSVLGARLARHHSRKKILSCEEVAPLHSFPTPRFSACASE